MASFAFWFPGTFASACGTGGVGQRAADPKPLAVLAGAYLSLSCVTQFIMNFCLSVTRTGAYNSIDNFYDPAPCGQNRPLKSGILLKASKGRLYDMIWVCKRLTFFLYCVMNSWIFLCRVAGALSSSVLFGSWSIGVIG